MSVDTGEGGEAEDMPCYHCDGVGYFERWDELRTLVNLAFQQERYIAAWNPSWRIPGRQQQIKERR